MIEAAGYFDRRLPEALAGYERSLTTSPVKYPTACSPQAWSTGAPLLILRAVLGLDPVGDHLVVAPALPPSIGQIELQEVPGRWGKADAFGRSQHEFESAPVEYARPT
jgi:glycogen debranching enzyme